jgi:hypothetical protein
MTFAAVLIPLALFATRGQAPTESFVRANYVRADPKGFDGTGYARMGAHRFRQAWVTTLEDLSPFQPLLYQSIGGRRVRVDDGGDASPYSASPGFTEAVDRVIKCSPELAPYRDEIFTTERVRFHGGEDVISFYLYRQATATAEPVFVSSLVLLLDGQCTALPIAPRAIDPDHGGRSRELWDLFDYLGVRYLLVQAHEYEARGFEVYRVNGPKLDRLYEFWFAYLGGG